MQQQQQQQYVAVLVMEIAVIKPAPKRTKERVSGSAFRPTPGAGSDEGEAIGETWMARSERLTTVVLRAQADGDGGSRVQSANAGVLRTAASPFPPFAACARSLFEVSRGGDGLEAAGANA